MDLSLGDLLLDPSTSLQDILTLEPFDTFVINSKDENKNLTAFWENQSFNLLETAIFEKNKTISERAYSVIRSQSKNFFRMFLMNRNNMNSILAKLINWKEKDGTNVGRFLEVVKLLSMHHPESTFTNIWFLPSLLQLFEYDVTFIFFDSMFKCGEGYQKWMSSTDFFISLLNSVKTFSSNINHKDNDINFDDVNNLKRLANAYLLISEFIPLQSFKTKCCSPFRIMNLLKVPPEILSCFEKQAKKPNKSKKEIISGSETISDKRNNETISNYKVLTVGKLFKNEEKSKSLNDSNKSVSTVNEEGGTKNEEEVILSLSKMLLNLFSVNLKNEYKAFFDDYLKIALLAENIQIKVNFMNIVATILLECFDYSNPESVCESIQFLNENNRKTAIFEMIQESLIESKNDNEIQQGLKLYLALLKQNNANNSERLSDIFHTLLEQLNSEQRPIQRIGCFKICSVEPKFSCFCEEMMMTMKRAIETEYGKDDL